MNKQARHDRNKLEARHPKLCWAMLPRGHVWSDCSRLKLENAFLILQARQCKGNFSDTNRPLLLFFLFDCVNWPLSMATCVPPHAAWTTFPQPFRGRWRGEFIWKINKRKMDKRYIYMNNRVNVEFGLSATCFLSFPPKPWPHPRIMNKSLKAISQLLQVPFWS